VVVNIRLFAMLRQQAGWRERSLELPAGSSIATAWQELARLHPDLQPSSEFVRFARNGEYAAPTQGLEDGDQLAIIPPVAGGSDHAEPLLRCELRTEPIEDELLAELRRTVPSASDGALVIFVGQTRETPGTPAHGQDVEVARQAGSRVLALEYEAFEEMALATFTTIGSEVAARFEVQRLAIIHRLGLVALTEPSVVVAAAAPHRAAAFDACRYAIDELKARSPIWKSEQYEDGSVWVGAPAREGPEVGT